MAVCFLLYSNKPFGVVGNKERGNARFDSSLRLFNLENRRVDITILDNIDLTSPIDWNRVNNLLSEMRKVSMDFLQPA